MRMVESTLRLLDETRFVLKNDGRGLAMNDQQTWSKRRRERALSMNPEEQDWRRLRHGMVARSILKLGQKE